MYRKIIASYLYFLSSIMLEVQYRELVRKLMRKLVCHVAYIFPINLSGRLNGCQVT